MMNNIATDIDDYISNFPMDIRGMLEEVRATIAKAAPKATEAIKYAMPTFVYKGNLVHFAAFKNHIGFYPAPTGIVAFAKELAPYKQGKGSIQFPIDEPIPLKLIAKIVQWRVKDNEERALAKKKK
jgi:uncharacterized protein YdhG (YjbR/CyaY superfamily)